MPDVMEMVARARVRTADEDWAAAAELWARVTAANPVNGDYWARLGEARFGAHDYAAARAAYEEVLRLGVRETFGAEDAPPLMPGEVAYRIARCEAAAGDREAAVAALSVALGRGMRDLARVGSDEHWRELRTDQRIRDMVGIIDASSMSRDGGWRYDLAFFVREIKRLAYAPFALQPEAEFDRAAAELDAAIPGLTGAQILVGMMKLVRYLDDGHALVTWPEDDQEMSRMLPVDMFMFTDGLYVIGAAPGGERLLGARVEKIGGLTLGEAMAALDPVMPRDNEHWLTLRFPVLVRYTAILEALGIGHALTVRLADGTPDEVRLEAAPIEFHGDRYPAGWVALADTVTLDGTVPVPPPLHLRHRELPFWFEYRPADDLVYFQFNSVRDHPAETFAAFCDRLFGFIEDRHAGRLVIDMRWNGGGNTLLSQHLLHHLIASERLSRRGALFVIIGRRTSRRRRTPSPPSNARPARSSSANPPGRGPTSSASGSTSNCPTARCGRTPPICSGRRPGPRTTGPGPRRTSTRRRRSRRTAAIRIRRWTPSWPSGSTCPAEPGMVRPDTSWLRVKSAEKGWVACETVPRLAIEAVIRP